MPYKLKNKNKEINRRASELHFNFIELNNKAQETYGTDFNKLDWKSQKQISKEVAKGFHWKVK